METVARKPLQGVVNIVRFNWHYYLTAAVVLLLFYTGGQVLPQCLRPYLLFAGWLLAISIMVSLFLSFYVYDISDLYTLNWLNLHLPGATTLVNIHAGFDETSGLVAARYPSASLCVFDFYDSNQHRELSIKRARKAYPPYPGTKKLLTGNAAMVLPSADAILCLLAAHEIRDRKERICFFEQLQKTLKPGGEIIVVEHLRDTANFFAYNVGALHFFSDKEWGATFASAGLCIKLKKRINPFITAYFLTRNGSSS